MFKKYVSNKIERLADLFADHIGGPGDVFSEDVVVVQSLGMSRWLNLRLADVSQEHIVANVNYFLPRNYIFKILRTLGLLPDVDYMSREYCRWNIYSVLPEYSDNSIISEYLKEPGGDLKRWQLSCKIAELFDHYMMYRYHPEFGLSGLWRTESESAEWQKQMFNQVSGDETVIDVLQVFTAVDHVAELKAILPKSLSLFSISNMPPIFLKFFYELSKVVDVNLFYLSPAEGFWGDIVEKRKLFNHEVDLDQYWESTNEFLALNCRLGQEFFLLLQDFEGEAGDVSEECFEPIERVATTLLHSFQNDLLYMEESSFDNACDSIVFSSCHSEVRELQVLYDYILHALNDDPELQPNDVLVMMPQIEKYAPYINAVFGHPESELLKIPFCLSDSKKSMTNDIACYLIKLIDLGQARITASEVMELLENEDIARKFKIHDGSKELLSQLVLDTNVAWGINRDFVEELCEVSFGNSNWHDCIHRWLSGYALSKEDSFFEDTEILPYDIEGYSESILVGRFVSFLYKLFSTIDDLKSAKGRSPAEWSEFLLDMVDTFFAKNYEKADYRNQVVQAIVNLELETKQVEFDGEISLSVVRDILYNSINSETTYAGFLQRGVTFCKLLPMRSVPAKVICLLGVNDGVFPRTDSFIDFDLMKFSRQIGERSARYEDRYLFLETLLAVRERLYISYIGQDVVTNEKKAPSIVVSELMDSLKGKLGDRGELCVQEHSIQPFNKKYFAPSGLSASFSKHNLDIALASSKRDNKELLYGISELGISNLEIPEIVQISSFLKFFKSPIKEFLRFSFDIIYRENKVDEFLENEPIKIEVGLNAWQLKVQAFEIMKKIGAEVARDKLSELIYSTFLREGVLPVGKKGYDEFCGQVFNDTYQIYSTFSIQTIGCVCEEFFVDVSGICNHSIQGNVVLYKGDEYKYVNYSLSKQKPKNEIVFRLEHLLVSVVVPECEGVIIFKDKVLNLGKIGQEIALQRLHELFEIYENGLNVPLAFHPEISFKVYKKGAAVDDKSLYDSLQGNWTTESFLDYTDLDEEMFYKYFGSTPPVCDSELFELVKVNALKIFELLGFPAK